MKVCLLLLLFSLKSSMCQRRITNGSKVDESVNTSFMVYLVAAEKFLISPAWPGWLCHGSIIHTNLVLTSAACLSEGVTNTYVISGYRKYVQPHEIENNECTKRTKRKIISYCSAKHKTYNSSKSYASWTRADIAIARVKPEFDFFDINYLNHCSYLPNTIRINLQKKYEMQNESIDVVVYGWGHAKYYRQTNDSKDYNEKYLRWSRTRIVPRKQCLSAYKSNRDVADTIENVGICTSGRGNLNANGTLRIHHRPTGLGCLTRKSGDTETNTTKQNCTNGLSSDVSGEMLDSTDNDNSTRRNGICQNDHGAPLVTWIGGRPRVIGVAAAFLVKKNMQCVGPYVYTSVRANSRFINCALEENKAGTGVHDEESNEEVRKTLRKSSCHNDDTFQMVRQDVAWLEDIHMPSDIERLDDYDLE